MLILNNFNTFKKAVSETILQDFTLAPYLFLFTMQRYEEYSIYASF